MNQFLMLNNDNIMINLSRVDTIMRNKHTESIEIYYTGMEDPQVFPFEDQVQLDKVWNKLKQGLVVYWNNEV